MCYDISFKVKLETISDYFPDLIMDDQIDLEFGIRDHIIGHAYGEHPIIYRSREDHQLHLKLMEWGCIPFYVKDEKAFAKQRTTMLNARSERILDDTKSYWHKIKDRRCLIPLTGTYEHRGIKGWKNKVPYFVKPKNQDMFFLPGLYSVAELVNKETGELTKLWTFTLITRDANGAMKNIHNDGDNRWRMPLYLSLDKAKLWLNEDLNIENYRMILGYEMPSEELEYYPVFTIRSPKQRPDQKPKYEYWEWEKLPPLGEMNPDPK
ncbi:MAG TPA: SOS response-associated peptidase family protein, partial [Puia sp.]|nr:SOS response-associated peptidase family protein [Puia sp.]